MNAVLASLVNGAIRLEGDGVAEEDARAFGRVFQRAWTRVPPYCQGALEGYWRGRVTPDGPRLVLYDDTWPRYRGAPRVVKDGHTLVFPIGLLKEIGEPFAMVALAHELAHVSLYACPEPEARQDLNTAEAADATEELVERRLLEWGFDQATLDQVDAWMTLRGFARFRRGPKTQPLP